MANKPKNIIYYEKAFSACKRCLLEAREEQNPVAKYTTTLANPESKVKEEVLRVEHAVIWTIDRHLSGWAQPTWRLLRNSFKFLIKGYVKKGLIPQDKANTLFEKMMSAKGLTKRQRIDSGKRVKPRRKLCTPDDIRKIEEYLSGKNHVWGDALVTWLKAGIASGLRPNEWITAEVRETDTTLYLKSENFKYNEERSYDPERELAFSKEVIPEDHILAIKKHVATCKGFLEEEKNPNSDWTYKRFSNGCKFLLFTVNKAIWPRRKSNINLYTGRHQFSANAKADSSVSNAERAAMMGHKSPKTSTEKYGRARHGSNGLSPEIANKAVLKKIQDVPISPAFSPKNKT